VTPDRTVAGRQKSSTNNISVIVTAG